MDNKTDKTEQKPRKRGPVPVDWTSELVIRALKITKEIYIKTPYGKRKKAIEDAFEKITGVRRSWGTIKHNWHLINKYIDKIKKP